MPANKFLQFGPFPLPEARDILAAIGETEHSEPHPFLQLTLSRVGEEHATVNVTLPMDDPSYPIDMRLDVLGNRFNRHGYLGSEIISYALLNSQNSSTGPLLSA